MATTTDLEASLTSAAIAPVLRPYQQELADRVWRRVSSTPRCRVIAQLPTGGGKTAIAADLIGRAVAATPNGVCVWVTHRAELAAQTQQALTTAGIQVFDWRALLPAERNDWQPGAVHLVSDRWRALPTLPNNPALMICDEAHHVIAGKMWERWLDWWPKSVVGLSATPTRLAKREGLASTWDVLEVGVSGQQLAADDWLAVPLIETADGDLLFDRDELETKGGDFTTASAEREAVRLTEIGSVVKHAVARLNAFKATRALWYVPSVATADLLVRQLRASGEQAGVITSNTPLGERSATLNDFRSAAIRNLVSVDVLLEGLDVPSCEAVVVMRPTQSLVVHCQMLGRALRPRQPGVDGGEVLVVDFAGNSSALGSPLQDFEWSLTDPPFLPEGQKVLTRCVSPTCFSLLPPTARFCVVCQSPQGISCGVMPSWEDVGGDPTQPDTALPTSKTDTDLVGCGVWRRWTRYQHIKVSERKRQQVRICDVCVSPDTRKLVSDPDYRLYVFQTLEWLLAQRGLRLRDYQHLVHWSGHKVRVCERRRFHADVNWKKAHSTSNPTRRVAGVRATYVRTRGLLWVFPLKGVPRSSNPMVTKMSLAVPKWEGGHIAALTAWLLAYSIFEQLRQAAVSSKQANIKPAGTLSPAEGSKRVKQALSRLSAN